MTKLPTVDISAENAHRQNNKRGATEMERSTGGATRAMCSSELQKMPQSCKIPLRLPEQQAGCRRAAKVHRATRACRRSYQRYSSELQADASGATKAHRRSSKPGVAELQTFTGGAGGAAGGRSRCFYLGSTVLPTPCVNDATSKQMTVLQAMARGATRGMRWCYQLDR
jgi:hypothetical protein